MSVYSKWFTIHLLGPYIVWSVRHCQINTLKSLWAYAPDAINLLLSNSPRPIRCQLFTPRFHFITPWCNLITPWCQWALHKKAKCWCNNKHALLQTSIMNHDSGFIRGITMIFCYQNSNTLKFTLKSII